MRRAHKTRIQGSSSPSRRPRCGAVGRQRRGDGVVYGSEDVIGGMWRAGGRKGRPEAPGVRGVCGGVGVGRPGGGRGGRNGGRWEGEVYFWRLLWRRMGGRCWKEGYTVVRDATTQFPGLLRTVRYDGRQAGRQESRTLRARARRWCCVCAIVCLRDSHDGAIRFPSPHHTHSPSMHQSALQALRALASSPDHQRQKQVRTLPLHCSATSPLQVSTQLPPQRLPTCQTTSPPRRLPAFPRSCFVPPLPAPSFTRTDTSRRRLRRIQSPRPLHPATIDRLRPCSTTRTLSNLASAHRARTCAGSQTERRGPISAKGRRGGRSVHRLPRYCGLGEVQRSGCSGD